MRRRSKWGVGRGGGILDALLDCLGLVWYEGICRDGRVLSRPIPETALIPGNPFGRGVLGQTIPAHPRLTPSPTHFLTWAESRTCTSRIIPVPARPRPKPYPDCTQATAASERSGGENCRRGGRGGEPYRRTQGWIPPSRSTSDCHRSWYLTGDTTSRWSCTPFCILSGNPLLFLPLRVLGLDELREAVVAARRRWRVETPTQGPTTCCCALFHHLQLSTTCACVQIQRK